MKSINNPKYKAPSVRAKLDKAWEHVTQHLEENKKKVFICNFCGKIIRGGGINRVKKHLAGRKGDVAPCTLVDPDVRFAFQSILKETDNKRKEKVSNVISDDDDDEEQDDVTLLNDKVCGYTSSIGAFQKKEVAESNTDTIVGPHADHLLRQPVHKGLAETELRTVIAEEATRAIQAAMPAILEQNAEMIRKLIADRIGVDKEEKEVNEDVVVVEKGDFSDCMPEFCGVCEPISSLWWILEIENIFKAIKCDDGDKVVYAVSKLRLEAKLWWDILKDKCGPTKMTWIRFKEVFKHKFCPIRVVMQQEEEFLTFEQGNQLVKEYTTHFVDMARFAEHLVATEERKIERYLRGLKIDIRESISTRKSVTFWEVVEAAQDIENTINRGFEDNNAIKRKRGRSGKNLNNGNKKTAKKVSFSDKHELFVFGSS